MTKSHFVLVALCTLGGAAALGGGCTINSTDNDDDGAGNSGNGSSTTNPTTTSSGGNGTGGYGGEGTGGYGGTSGPGTGGAGPLPSNCDPAAGDTACDTCAKTSCCNEIEACIADANCQTQYGDVALCLYPDGQNWSGYSTNYCKLAVLGDNPDTTPAGKVISCIADPAKCGTDDKCGSETPDTWGNFVADFTEQYCAGCHFDGYVSDGGVDTADYSTDTSWFEPFGDASWFNWMVVNNVKADADMWWCGLATTDDGVPSECSQFTWSAQDQADCANSSNSSACSGNVVAGQPRFPKPERFPPHRDGNPPSTDHYGFQLHCWWMPNLVCEQPDAVTRRRVISWIVDGMPE